VANIAVIGCGYVGVVSSACFAKLGHHVISIDIDQQRIAALRQGRSPVFEPGIEELIAEGLALGRLEFHDKYPERLNASIVFIAVNTPGSQEGAADLRAVRDAVATVAARIEPGTVLVNKSTVPIGTGELVHGMANSHGRGPFSVVSNPEFLREGSAVADFMNPDRIVLGGDEPAALDAVAELYASLNAMVHRVDIRTAEMIKYASNAFLATKISFINEMAAICEALGADIEAVALGMGSDSRISPHFLRAGIGWGGSCFPKDVRALTHMAEAHGAHPQLLRSVSEINHHQRLRLVAKLRRAVGHLDGRRILILGASFKADTDDTRNSPALELARLLILEGATVVVHDPVVTEAQILASAPGVLVARDVFEGAAGVEAIVLATDWHEYRALDLTRLRDCVANPLLVDGRNAIDAQAAREAGFEYRCIGRPGLEGPPTTHGTTPLMVTGSVS
jgi:UDPglucose 6-dehydrogenase